MTAAFQHHANVAAYFANPVAEPQLSFQPRFGNWKFVLPTMPAAFAGALVEFAEARLASVVWPVLDDLLVAAVNASRPPECCGSSSNCLANRSFATP